jgi:hypothetical protein
VKRMKGDMMYGSICCELCDLDLATVDDEFQLFDRREMYKTTCSMDCKLANTLQSR